jgi:hypothetical protein
VSPADAERIALGMPTEAEAAALADPWASLFAEVRAEIDRISDGADESEGLLPTDNARTCLDVASCSLPSSRELAAHPDIARKQLLLAAAWLFGTLRAIDREASR